MSSDCNKYQSLYVFRNDEEFQHHLDTCETCRKKHAELLEVEDLIKFSKPAYFRSKIKSNTIRLNKAIAGIIFLILTSFVFNNFSELTAINTKIKHPELSDFISNSFFNQMQLPTDDYGILDTHKEISYD